MGRKEEGMKGDCKRSRGDGRGGVAIEGICVIMCEDDLTKVWNVMILMQES